MWTRLPDSQATMHKSNVRFTGGTDLLSQALTAPDYQSWCGYPTRIRVSQMFFTIEYSGLPTTSPPILPGDRMNSSTQERSLSSSSPIGKTRSGRDWQPPRV